MKTIGQIVEEQQNNLNKIKGEEDSATRDVEFRKFLIKLSSGLLKFLRNETLKAEITNQNDYKIALKRVEDAVRAIPKTEKVSVSNFESIIRGLDGLKIAVGEIKFPEIPKVSIPDNKKELLSIEKAVKAIKIPEVKIPEFPKIPEVDFSALIKEIKGLKKALSVPTVDFDAKTQKDSLAVLGNLESGLANLGLLLQALINKEVPVSPDRTDEVLAGLKAVTETIQNLKFPVPNTSSSWQHSLTMQSEDMAKTIVWTTVAGTAVPSTMTFVAYDGKTYRKTFSYDGSANCTGWTKWTEV